MNPGDVAAVQRLRFCRYADDTLFYIQFPFTSWLIILLLF